MLLKTYHLDTWCIMQFLKTNTFVHNKCWFFTIAEFLHKAKFIIAPVLPFFQYMQSIKAHLFPSFILKAWI